jgi:metallo-beta-lactamase family protein
MFQGGDFNEARNHEPLGFDPKELSAVLITHAHLDHIGRLPLLIKNGYERSIYATAPTCELIELILHDAFEVMQYNARKLGTTLLYDDTDIARVMEQVKPIEYHEPLTLKKIGSTETIQATWFDSGHIFGAGFIELQAEGKKVVFSGDVGNANMPILRETEDLPQDLDVLVCESTYGNRSHEMPAVRQKLIETMVAEAIGRGGVLMIPSFSLERTQELIYDLNDLIDRHHELPRIPIFLDSPLAIGALKVYRKYPEYYDEKALALYKAGDDLFQFPGLTMCETREESKKINNTPGPKIIIAGAGMMNGGRIVHHALRYLSDERNTLLIIGYQAQGTLGRQILDGESPAVTAVGETRAEVLSEQSDYVEAVPLFIGWVAQGESEKAFEYLRTLHLTQKSAQNFIIKKYCQKNIENRSKKNR